MSGRTKKGFQKVLTSKILPCLSCPICKGLITEATTITECLHTFCKKCIHEKFEDEEFTRCPVCYKDLGPNPLQKLRPDHSMENLRASLFPCVELVGSSDDVSRNPPRVKPKQRRLSSFNAPSPQSSTTGTKSKDLKELEDCALNKNNNSGFPADPTAKSSDKGKKKMEHVSSINALSPQSSTTGTKSKDLKELEDCTSKDNNSGFPANTNPKFSDKGKQKMVVKTSEEGKKPEENNHKTDHLKRSKRLVEKAAAKNINVIISNSNNDNKNKNNNDNNNNASIPEGSVADSISLATLIDGMAVSRVDKRGKKPKVGSASPRTAGPPIVAEMAIKERYDAGPSVQALSTVEGLDLKELGLGSSRVIPIWFSLVASSPRDGYRTLPQISVCCLCIKNPLASVDSMQKYISNKLELSEGVEVVIMLKGTPLSSHLTLKDLVGLWKQTVPPTEFITVTPGSSAEKIMMVFHYCLKA